MATTVNQRRERRPNHRRVAEKLLRERDWAYICGEEVLRLLVEDVAKSDEAVARLLDEKKSMALGVR